MTQTGRKGSGVGGEGRGVVWEGKEGEWCGSGVGGEGRGVDHPNNAAASDEEEWRGGEGEWRGGVREGYRRKGSRLPQQRTCIR